MSESESSDLAREDVPEHSEVAEETVEGMLESCRAILLKDKMPDPGEAIAEDWEKNQDHEIAGEKEEKEKRDHGSGADEMQTTAHEIRMLT